MSMTSRAYKISEEEFTRIIAESPSCAAAMRTMGFKCTTGNANVTVRRRIQELGLNIEHWSDNTKQAHIANTLSNEEYFVKDKPRNGANTRKRIIKYNLLPYKCDCCGNPGYWNGQELILQIDHINGDHNDNRLENLRFLCPNCHSQTDTFGGHNHYDED